MRLSTLCYITCDDEYLMLYRNKKENDLNEGKWIGLGGKIEEGETPLQGVIREVSEEAGIELDESQITDLGLVHFRSDVWEDEEMYLFKACLDSKPDLVVCDEGTLQWVKSDKVLGLPTWEGDRVFLEAMFRGETGIHITLSYEGEKLVQVINHN